MRILLVLCALFGFLHRSSGQEYKHTDWDESRLFRMKHMLLEMSPWSGCPIVETVPQLLISRDSLASILRQPITEIVNKGEIYLKFPFTFIVECDGSVTSAESMARVRQDIADSILAEFKNIPKWLPGTNNDHPVRTLILVSVNLSANNIFVEVPIAEDASRLPRMSNSFSGTWIQNRKDWGVIDTLRLTGSTYFMSFLNEGKNNKIYARIIEHFIDPGYVKLKYQKYYRDTLEIRPESELLYFTYSSKHDTIFTAQDERKFPSRNLLEYNASCNVWKRLKN